MDFTAPRRTLLAALDTALPASDHGSEMPILHSLQVSAKANGNITIAATDLLVSCVARIQSKVKTPGSACVPAKLFRDVVARMKEGDVTVTLKGSSCSIKGTGSRAATSIPTMPGEDFPSIPSITDPAATVPAAMLSALLRITRPSMSIDTTRPHLACVMLEMTGSMIRAVSTDGHRLAKVERKYEGSRRGPWLVPSAFLSRVKIPDEGDLQVSGGPKGPAQIEWGAEDARITWTTKVVDAAYPSYEQVIPSRWYMTADCARKDLIDAIKTVGVAADHLTLTARTEAAQGEKVDTIKLHAENAERCAMTDELAAETGPGNSDHTLKGVRIGLGSEYIAQALSSLSGDRVTLGFTGELGPMVILSPDEAGYIGIIMPRRI